MNQSLEQAFEAAAVKMGGKRLLHFTLTESDESILSVYVVGQDTSQKVALLVSDTFTPIEFDTPFGKQMWVKGWGLLQGTKILLVEDGMTQSLGLYRIDGSRTSMNYNSPLNTLEVFYRIRRQAIRSVGDTPFLLRPVLSTLAEMPTVGSM